MLQRAAHHKQKAFLTKCLFVYFLCHFLFPVATVAQDSIPQKKLSFLEPSPVYNKKRARFAGYSTLGVYVVGMAGLYQLWYSDYNLEKFHFFNDNGEWLQMDKIGHTFSAYVTGKQGYNICRWTGMENKRAAWIGGNMGWVFMASIEVLDGFSAGWGFSTGDIIANSVGSATFVAQQLTWKEQRITFKISDHATHYAKYRPDQLGANFQEQLFKDYNGQTLWLSGNIHSFLPEKSKFPRWLNIAIGYGAEGMTGSRSNPLEYNGSVIPNFERYRQFYLSPDIDFTKIKTRSKILKFIFEVTSYIKIPKPTLEYNSKKKFVFHGLYF